MDCCYILQRNIEELERDWLPTEREIKDGGNCLSGVQREMMLRRHAERALNFREWRMV